MFIYFRVVYVNVHVCAYIRIHAEYFPPSFVTLLSFFPSLLTSTPTSRHSARHITTFFFFFQLTVFNVVCSLCFEFSDVDLLAHFFVLVFTARGRPFHTPRFFFCFVLCVCVRVFSEEKKKLNQLAQHQDTS
uniref:Uncharacterized protein n=1 Tax=Trypanosoma vivax (strain Y486) TaxID=1055687 RepID=G0U7M0_TRYVY|nr:hypothetical protein TVY486_1009230 [Trypanosoma vivax Y486]